jgi:hypothetical protein
MPSPVVESVQPEVSGESEQFGAWLIIWIMAAMPACFVSKLDAFSN